jgi:hypothetical protein
VAVNLCTVQKSKQGKHRIIIPMFPGVFHCFENPTVSPRHPGGGLAEREDLIDK